MAERGQAQIAVIVIIVIFIFLNLFMVQPISPSMTVTFSIQKEPGTAYPKLSLLSASYAKVPITVTLTATRDQALIARLTGSKGIYSLSIGVSYQGRQIAQGKMDSVGEGTYEARLYLFPRSEDVGIPYIWRTQIDGVVTEVSVWPR